MNEQQVRQLVTGVVTQLLLASGKKTDVPAEVSARHVHLSQADVERLFGAGHTLTPKRDLSQPGQFLSEERVSVVTGKGEFRNVAVLGPARSHTQVELSLTDAKALGLKAPTRQSGDTAGCPGVCILAGDKLIEAQECAMVVQNHIHMTPADAAAYGVTDGQRVKVQMRTSRPITFDDVVIRVREDFALAMHIDFDEANACAFQKDDVGRILLPGQERQTDPDVSALLEDYAVQLGRFGVHSAPPAVPAAPVREAPAVPVVRSEPFSGLLTAEAARKRCKDCGEVLYVTAGTVVTPLARDVLREKKVRLEEESPC